MNRIVAIYTRVSTDQQVTVTQDDQCFGYCAFKKGADPLFETPLTYEDSDVSGSMALAKRPGAGRLLQAVQRGEVAHIVVAKLDRLGRSAEDVLRVVRICEKHRTVVHFTDLGGDIITTGGSAGRMVITMMAAFAEFERNRIQERIVERMQSKRRQCTIEGSWGEVCGTIPYGWQAQTTTRTNAQNKPVAELVIHPQEHDTLLQLIDFRYGPAPRVEDKEVVGSLAGRPPSYRSLARWLNGRHTLNKSGGPWSAGSVAHVLNNTYTRKLIEQRSYETNPHTALP